MSNIEPAHSKRLYIRIPKLYVAWTSWEWSYYSHKRRWCILFADNRSDAAVKADRWFFEVYGHPMNAIPLPDYGVIRIGNVWQALKEVFRW